MTRIGTLHTKGPSVALLDNFDLIKRRAYAWSLGDVVVYLTIKQHKNLDKRSKCWGALVVCEFNKKHNPVKPFQIVR